MLLLSNTGLPLTNASLLLLNAGLPLINASLLLLNTTIRLVGCHLFCFKLYCCCILTPWKFIIKSRLTDEHQDGDFKFCGLTKFWGTCIVTCVLCTVTYSMNNNTWVSAVKDLFFNSFWGGQGMFSSFCWLEQITQPDIPFMPIMQASFVSFKELSTYKQIMIGVKCCKL